MMFISPVFAGECVCVCKSICVNTPEMSIVESVLTFIYWIWISSNLNVVRLTENDTLKQTCTKKKKTMTEALNNFPKPATLLGAHCTPVLVITDNSEACV